MSISRYFNRWNSINIFSVVFVSIFVHFAGSQGQVAHSSNIIEKFQEHDNQINCNSLEFRCQDGQCIDESFVCDGSRECADGTDETRHLCQSKRCNDMQFQCHYGACIEKNHTCDGDKQCWDGSDEFPHLCEHVAKIRNRRKRAVNGSCAVPATSADKTLKFVCKSPSKSCKPTKNGYVPEGTAAIVTCASGYSRVREEEFPDHICTYDSKWRPSIKKCLKICDKLKISNVIFKCYQNGQIIDNCTENSILLAGTNIQDIKCKPTHRYENGPSYFQISCDESGKWDRPLLPCTSECGLSHGSAQAVIAGGRPAKEGDSPWQVAIFNKMKTVICGGTIIHELLVISAAHCFFDNAGDPVNIDDFEVVVGKYTSQYDTTDNKFQRKFKIKEIRYSKNGYNGIANYLQGDIAIIILTQRITTSPVVMRACINWQELKNDDRSWDGELGKVTGWGLTENNETSIELRTIDLPVIETKRCKNMVPEQFLPFITTDKFCAGTGNDTGASIRTGDSGGGILFMDNGRYYLRGVASVKQTISDSVGVFTNLRWYIDIISETLQEVEKKTFEFAPSTTDSEVAIFHERRTLICGGTIIHELLVISEYPTPRVAKCQPESRIVNLMGDTRDPTLVQFPCSTRVGRCGGCCTHPSLSCQPTELEYKNFTVRLYRYAGNQKFERVQEKVVTLEIHKKCKCNCAIKAQDCSSSQTYNEEECRCMCLNKDEERKCSYGSRLKLWNPWRCSCDCREGDMGQCGTGQIFDYNSCGCKQSQSSYGSNRDVNYNSYNNNIPKNNIQLFV